MYVREKQIRRREKVYSYYQLVEGERIDGRVRQRVVHHLGRYPSRQHADMVARRAGLLCAVLGCGKPATVFHNVETVLAELGERDTLKVCHAHSTALDAGESVYAYH